MRSQDQKAIAKKKAQTRKTLGKIGIAVVLLIGIVATVVLIAVMGGDEGEVLADMAVGECYLGEDPNEGIEIVGCTEQHHGELYAVIPPPEEMGDDFDPRFLSDAVETLCLDEVEGYVGLTPEELDEEGYRHGEIMPPEDEWNNNHRDSYCVLGAEGGQVHSVPLQDFGEGSDADESDEAAGEGEGEDGG